MSTGNRDYTGWDALQLLMDLGLEQQVSLLNECCPASQQHHGLVSASALMVAAALGVPKEVWLSIMPVLQRTSHAALSAPSVQEALASAMFLECLEGPKACAVWLKKSLTFWPALCETQAALYPKVHNLTYPLPELEMRIHCLHGSGVDTAEHFTYDVPRFSDSAPPAPSHVKEGPGDGTVNLRSLEAGGRYADVSHTHGYVGCRAQYVAATV